MVQRGVVTMCGSIFEARAIALRVDEIELMGLQMRKVSGCRFHSQFMSGLLPVSRLVKRGTIASNLIFPRSSKVH
jgi:hypothetical protein